MTVGIVEDHILFRDLVRGICQKLHYVEVVFEADNGFAAIEGVLTLRPDLLVLDIGLPDIGGCEVLDKIHHEGASPRTFVMSALCTPYLEFRLGQIGIDAFIDKSTVTLASLKASLNEFLNNRKVFSSSFIAIQEKRKKDPLSFDKLLTKQQMRVLSLVARNMNDRDICKELNIGLRTVENHRTEIMRKIGTHSRVDLMRFAANQGFGNGFRVSAR